MNKFEKLIEYIINEDEARAKALFHQIVVEKSRDIYESLVDEDIHIHHGSDTPVQEAPIEADMGSDDLGAEIGGAQDEIAGDEMGGLGDELGGDEMGGDDMGAELGGDDMGAGDEMGDEMGGEAGIEDRVMDLEDAIDELKAEFDNLMGDEGDGDADDMGGDDLGAELGGDGDADDMGGEDDGDADDMGDDEVGTEELGDEDEVEGDSKFGEASVYSGQTGNSKTMESKKSDKKDADKKAKAEKDKKDAKKDMKETKSPSDLMREYVEKVSLNWPTSSGDGDEIGAGGKKQPINSKSVTIGGKNDMGGTTANILKGGTASDKDSNTGPKDPSNEYTKGGGKNKKMGQDKYENSPAANTKGYKNKQTVQREKEGQTTKDSVSVDKKSFNPGGKSGYKG